jgi:hypothetical protein
MKCCEYETMDHIHNSIFFVPYKWSHYTSLLHYTRLKRIGKNKHSNLLGPFASYEENEVL